MGLSGFPHSPSTSLTWTLTFTTQSFLQVPDPLNVTVGAVAEFYCRVEADVVFLTVNDEAVNQLVDTNICQVDGPFVDGFRTQILRITADVQYNNSVIHCRSFTSGEGEAVSGPALLMMQGLLSAPTNMKASRPNSSAIHLNWDPPFTLDITNVDPDIPGYTVSITNNNTKVKRNVTEPEFLFQEEDHDPCHVYSFRVRARNPVGMGNKSDVIDECFGGVPESANVSSTMISDTPTKEQTTLQLIITYDMSCHGRRPDSIDINITLNDGSQMTMDPPTLSETGRLEFQLVFSIYNVPCGIHVTVRNQFGDVTTNVLLEDDCEPRVTDDKDSSENNLAIPIAAGICGAVIGLVILTVVLLIFIKCRGDQDNIKDLKQPTEDNEYTAVPVKDPHYPESQASSSSVDSQTALTSETANSQGSELQYAELDLQQQRQIQQNAPPPFQPVAYTAIQPKTEAT